MRCPDCNKFVPQEVGDPEVNDITYDPENHTVTADVRVVVTCGECGTELKEANLSMETEAVIRRHNTPACELEVEEDSCEGFDDYITKDRHGKPIKNPRYQTHLYGARVEFSITCACLGKNGSPLMTGTLEDSIPAGSMDEL